MATVVLVALMASLATAMPFTIENSKEIYEATNNATSSLACPPGFMLHANSCVCADWPNAMITCDDES